MLLELVAHRLLLADHPGREVAGKVSKTSETEKRCEEGEIGDGSWIFLRWGWFGWKMVANKELVAKAMNDKDCSPLQYSQHEPGQRPADCPTMTC
jgi:hypothetical protein